ncbi:Ribose-5-phosphate isomerase A [Arsenophonus endosymbiont of Aleurodicus dispersus]|uniref:ribose-5-phosphate isomerase RpiA n=1 Tax=Arsenophonus endosymbiont of Aleurodicus dispersus TaxID=235559 RepID=UPI000EB2ECFC|nr:ribose-5-phosphate isomerase RpiA [Arsenophonus endosymbiont of Aleurodicus dispersus]VAY02345.1 Ribose-5-phosphate isomerase A [Arsenophonus endosymbiont of Aleurodicus dispersus]
MTQDKLKKIVGCAALEYIKPDMVVGVGTGSTVAYFIDRLATKKHLIKGAVSSSVASTDKLISLAIPIIDSKDLDGVDIYIDGANEFNPDLMMIKGGGAALTREKVIAAMAKQFIAIADKSKQVDILGEFPLPVEVIPMARSYVSRQLVKLGGMPEYRQNVVTDNGNVILDIYNLKILNPIALENKINAIAGVVTVGLFANRAADIILLATLDGVKKLTAKA